MTTGIETVHWSAPKGNGFSTNFNLQMLLEGGYTVNRKCKLRTDSNYGLPDNYLVLYDRSYITAKLRHTLLPLADLGRDGLLELLTEVIETLDT